MNLIKCFLLMLALSASSAFASVPQQFSCDYNSSEGFKEFKFNLSDYTTIERGVELNAEVQVGAKTISVSVLSRSGTVEVSLLEARGVYTVDDTCAEGGCPVGSPKMGALLKSLTRWEVGKPAMTESYASPKSGEFYRVTCYIGNL